MSMKLYTHPLSGHSHRAVLFASLIGAPTEIVVVDLMKGDHKQPAFLALNRFGQVPVLVDGERVIADSNAILVYLARKTGRSDWHPTTPEGEAAVQRWLSVAAGPLAFGPAAARLITVFGAKYNSDEVIARSHALLTVANEELAERLWLVGAQPTIADVALYSYIAHAPEGNVDLSGYAHVREWLARIEALPGFTPFQSTKAGLRAAA